MPVNPDIRKVKRALREKYLNVRKTRAPEKKRQLDAKITRKLLNLWSFREAQTVLCYVSTPIEVDTLEIIRTALAMGKKVAVPKCAAGKPQMDFYYIDSLDELRKQSFGLLEPEGDESKRFKDHSNGFCIVPALSFDLSGRRLGFGGGYYDRFLSRFRGLTAGLCYEDCIAKELPCGRYDKSVDMIVTESRFYKSVPSDRISGNL